MTTFLERAEAMARDAHAGQKYGDGNDYVEAHILPVVTIIKRLGYGPEYQATGWLHDIIEDTTITPEVLLSEGIPKDVVRAVEFLSKTDETDHAEYLKRIITNKYATVVKFADSSANFSSTMMLSPKLNDTRTREWALEYAGNLAYLLPYLVDPTED